jgi:heat-inducible transcriptional repressor
MSPATVRNAMSDLEYLGYINHPHTSAGRIPTDKGYRFYVDSLMGTEKLTESEKRAIQKNLAMSNLNTEEVLKESSKILGKISHQLSIVSAPHLYQGILEKLELIGISSTRLLVIISVQSKLVKTIMVEVASEIPRDKLEDISRFLNERLSGLTLQQIRETFTARVRDAQNEDTGLIRLFIDSADKLFDDTADAHCHIAGAQDVLTQPEFENPENFRTVIELIDNEDIIIHLLAKREQKEYGIAITIGEENKDEKLKNYSIVTSQYHIGNLTGTVGIIGPKRMNYSKMVPVVDYMAKMISNILS